MGDLLLTLTPREPRRGLWCALCFLPSGMAIDIDVTDERDMPMGTMAMRTCVDCGHGPGNVEDDAL